MNVDKHISVLLQEGAFKRHYRMSYSSFEKMIQTIGPFLEINEQYSFNRTGVPPIHPVGQIEMTLSWLGGGSYRQVRAHAGISSSYFYDTRLRVMNVINENTNYDLKFPTTNQEIHEMADLFKTISNNGIISGCIGCIDGWLCPIQTPRDSEVKHVRSFYSGHYRMYGINIQACCDHVSRITAFQCKAPGGRNDVVAFLGWGLKQHLENMKGPFFVIGDNAYTQSTTLMTPFNKLELQIDQVRRDSYNFYISQLRIRIEMAFGLLVNKWRVLKTPLECRFRNCNKIINACIRLHNYTISERILEIGDDFCLNNEIVEARQYYNNNEPLIYNPVSENEEAIEHEYLSPQHAGNVFRELIVDHIANHNMSRPVHNIINNVNSNN